MISAAGVSPGTQSLEHLWTSLQAAVHDDAHPFHTFVLATVGPDNVPQARLMTLRGVDVPERRLWLHAHQGSAKVAQLKLNSAFEGVFLDPPAGSQVRVRGTAVCHRLDDAASRAFEQGAAAASKGPPGTLDLLWPGSPEALQHAVTRRAFLEFTAIELTVDEIVWLRVSAKPVVHQRFRAATGFRPEPAEG